MDKMLGTDSREMAQRPYKQKKGRILITLILSIIVILSLLQFNSVFIDVFPLNRFFHSSCQHTTPTSSTQDFQLVSIHRAGIGRTRNQIYQILNIPPTSIKDTTSPFHHSPLTLSSIPRKTTHLANLSRHSITNYLTQSRLFKQS